MPLDAYSACPCGSGKKFKWCCQPIHKDIDRAFQQESEEQHDTALRIMEEVTSAHPTNPEAWGRQAQLLYQNDRVEDAENALEKAFAINPNYPFGLLLRGMFRYHEQEAPGALLLFRRAAEAYDPDAADALAQAYAMIGDCEMKLNRPVAARAAIRISLHYRPDNEELTQALSGYFGDESRMPLSARREWTFLHPAPTVGGDRRAAWDKALTGTSPRLGDYARAFARLTQEDARDSAAWFNLGLALAWLGDNPGALEALDKHVELEPDERQAETAWALGEVLRLGHGMEAAADYVEHSVTYQIRNMQPIVGMLQQWDQVGKITGVQADQEAGLLSGIVLEDAGSVLVGASGGERPRRIAATLLVLGPVLRLRHGNLEQLRRVRSDVEKTLGNAISTPNEHIGHGNFGDVVQDALVFVTGVSDREVMAQRSRELAARYYEETWIHRPLKSLGRTAPVDAAGQAVLRKKVRGVILFQEQCSAGGLVGGYDFNRLRDKLGLSAEAGGATASGTPSMDFGSMSAADLAALPAESLADEQLEKAYQSAIKLDAHELAGNFARAIVARPVRADQPDRSPWYFYLIQRSLREGSPDAALTHVDEGERADCEHNEGRQRNEYEMRRGQVHSKRGDADEAFRVFENLLQRDPMNQKTRATAAEAMLTLKQPARALKLAEEGVAAARKLNDRDSEEHFLELTRAARKQGA